MRSISSAEASEHAPAIPHAVAASGTDDATAPAAPKPNATPPAINASANRFEAAGKRPPRGVRPIASLSQMPPITPTDVRQKTARPSTQLPLMIPTPALASANPAAISVVDIFSDLIKRIGRSPSSARDEMLSLLERCNATSD